MKDIQSQRDHRRINIKKVGVKNISYPVTLLDKERKEQRTIASVNMYVNLPHHFKGTHMSRFVEILNRFHGRIDLAGFRHILTEMKGKLQAAAAHMEIEFPYFLKKKGQPSAVGISEYLCRMHGSLEDDEDLTLEIEIPIWPPLPPQAQNVLPKSLGRWGVAKICLRFRHFIWIEDLIQAVEEVVSRQGQHTPACDTDRDDKNLAVEQITKAIGARLAGLSDNIHWFTVNVKNFSEGFNTFATLEWPGH